MDQKEKLILKRMDELNEIIKRKAEEEKENK